MKNRDYSLLIILLISISLLDAKAQSIEFNIQLLNRSQGIIEPVFVKWIAINKGNTFQAFNISTAERRPQLQYKKLGSKRWLSIRNSEVIPTSKNKAIVTDLPPYRPELPSMFPENYKVDSKTFYLPLEEEKSYNPIFSSPGKYLVRLKACPFYTDSTCLYSGIDTITIMPYNGKENAAYKWVQSKDVSRFLFNAAIDGLTNEFSFLNERLALANELIEKYGDTSLGNWAKYYVASCYMQFFNDDKGKLKIGKEFMLEVISTSKNSVLTELAKEALGILNELIDR